ncbi:MAG: hypothetical protein AB7O43_18330, partial [Hyphomicrobiaceae bacterium]
MENGLDDLLDKEGAKAKEPPSMGVKGDDPLPIETLVQWYEDAEEASQDARRLAERDRDYYDHKQLTEREIKTLEARGQPVVILNRIQPKINYLIGYEAENRTDPRAFPRNPQDEGSAEACTDSLRFVEDDSGLKDCFSQAWEYMLIEGMGGIELAIRPNGNDAEIEAIGWDWDRLFFDPHSRKHDFDDARYKGGIVWLDKSEAQARWSEPAQLEALERTCTNEASLSDTYEDRPAWKQWVSGKGRNRVRIVQMYYTVNGQWYHATFTKGGKLEGIRVPFVDQDGQSWCPLFLASSFVDRKNNRYGLVRQMIGAQDEVNKRRSKALHRLSQRTVIADKDAVDDVEEARGQLARVDGWVEKNPMAELEVLKNEDQLAAELGMLQEAKNEIEMYGPNAALQGKDDRAPSGRAL